MSVNPDVTLTLNLSYQGTLYPMTLQLIRTTTNAETKKRTLYFRATQTHPIKTGEKICVQAIIAPTESAGEVNDAEARRIFAAILE